MPREGKGQVESGPRGRGRWGDRFLCELYTGGKKENGGTEEITMRLPGGRRSKGSNFRNDAKADETETFSLNRVARIQNYLDNLQICFALGQSTAYLWILGFFWC